MPQLRAETAPVHIRETLHQPDKFFRNLDWFSFIPEFFRLTANQKF